MLQKSLNKIGNTTAVIGVGYNTFSYGEIQRHTHAIVKTFEMLELNKNEAVGIYNRCNFENICSLYACFIYGANFTIINSSDSEDVLFVKKPLIGIDLLLSDFYDDPYTLTLNPKNGKLSVNSRPIRDLRGESLNNFRKNVDRVFEIFFEEKSFHAFPNEELSIDESLLAERMASVYHKGATGDTYKIALFTLDRIVKGIENSCKKLDFEGDKLLFLESFDLLYDVVNGIINPISKGVEIQFANMWSIETALSSCMNYRATDVYVHAYTLEKILEMIDSNLPDWVRALKVKSFTYPLYKLLFRWEFFKVFGNNLRHLIVTGKINRINLIKSLGLKVTTLYTMTEIASFVALKSHSKLKKDYSVGKINTDHISIVGKRSNRYGGIMVYAEDMEVSCLPAEHLNESFQDHKLKGRLWTRDIGYLDSDDELHVINKSNLIFEMDNGKMVPTGEMLEIALRSPFVKDALIVKPLGDSRRLVMLIEPNTDYVEERSLDLENLQFMCNELRVTINSKFKNSVPLHNVLVFTDPEGISRETFKIVSRSQNPHNA